MRAWSWLISTAAMTRSSARAKALIARYAGDSAAVSVSAGGLAGVNVDVNSHVTHSLAVAEAIAVPVTMVLLILAFGSVIAALLPLVIGGLAIVGTFAELYLLGSVTDVSIFAINLTTALGLGLGIDYALFMVSRFREQLAAGDDTARAVAITVATAGRTIVFSAATVAAALAAMLVFPLYFLRSFALRGHGCRGDRSGERAWWLLRRCWRCSDRVSMRAACLGHAPPRGAASPWWGRLAGAVMRRPAWAALPVVAVLLAAGRPVARRTVRHGNRSRRAARRRVEPSGVRGDVDAIPGQRDRTDRCRHHRRGRPGSAVGLRDRALTAARRRGRAVQRGHVCRGCQGRSRRSGARPAVE